MSRLWQRRTAASREAASPLRRAPSRSLGSTAAVQRRERVHRRNREMLSTVAVEIVQRGAPADRDRIARPVLKGFLRCPETLEADGDDTALPRAGESAADLWR